MLTQLTHVNVWVHDQDDALKFYTEKLGLELRGFKGPDTLAGGVGKDCLYTVDGVSGNDTARGGPGHDEAGIDPGDHLISVEETGPNFCAGD